MYALHFICSFTSKSDVALLYSRDRLFDSFKAYKMSSENHFARFGYRLLALRLDSAGEFVESNKVHSYLKSHGIELDPSPTYTPQSHGMAERLVPEH